MGKASRPKPGRLLSPDGLWEVQTNGNHLVILRQGQAESIELNRKLNPVLGPLRFSGDSAYLAVADSTNVHLVDLKHGNVRLLGHPAPVTFSEFSPDNSRLVCASAFANATNSYAYGV